MKAAEALGPGERNPLWVRIAVAGGCIAVFLAVLTILPLSIPPYLDFQVLYQTNMGLLRGISPYDHAGQVNMIAQMAHAAPEQVYALPFPYPPWYALSTVWLAWLPIEAAVRLWFGISLLLLMASMWLLTDGWPTVRRLIGLGLAIFFLPVLGSLSVGQYGFPVLMGAALVIYGLRHERAGLIAAAAALLTFKPHIGALIIVAMLVYLWRRPAAFARRAMLYTLAAGAVLFLVGFLVDQAWPVNYVRSLLAFRQDEGVATCGLCASLPAIIANHLPGGAGLAAALWIGILILLLLIGIWLWKGRASVPGPGALVAHAILIVLLASPYLLNYDFLLLLVPFVLLAEKKRTPVEWALLVVAYTAPYVALGLWGRQGNFILPLCAAVLLLVIYKERRPLDVSMGTA